MAALTRRTTLAAAASVLAAPYVRAAGPRRLLFWHSYADPARAAAIKSIVGQVESANAGLTVALEIIPYAGFADKWAAAQASSNLPDLTALDARCTAPMAAAGALTPPDDLISAVGGQGSFEPGLLDAFARYRGAYVAVPHSAENRLLIYRRDRLAAANIDIPVTWDDVLQAATAMTKAPDYYGWMLRLGRNATGAGQLLWTMTRSAGGSFFDDDGTSTFDQPPVREAVDFIADLARRSGMPPGMSDAQPSDDFTLMSSGRVSMASAPVGLLGQAIAQKPDLANQLDVVPMPIRVRVGNLLSGVSVALPKGRNPDDAKKLAAALYAEKTYAPFLLTPPLTLFPALQAAEGPFQKDPVVAAHPEAVRATLDGLATGSLPGMERGLNPYAGPVFDSHIVEDMMSAIVLKNANPADAIADASKKIATVLRATKDKLSKT